MNIKKLLEEFVDRIKEPYDHHTHEVFVNPTSNEIKEVEKSLRREDKVVRYIVDVKKKKVYLFNEYLLHFVVAKAIGIPYQLHSIQENNKSIYIFGEGFILRNKIKPIFGMSLLKEVNENNWLNRYFDL